jgi:hypothetical protein
VEKRKRRTLKKTKDSELKIRISIDRKKEIKEYCKKKQITMTAFLNLAIDGILDKTD